jgi:2-phospho-L-lactate guanylyltransferase
MAAFSTGVVSVAVTRIVVPFRGSGAKLRLAPLPERERAELALAMLGDVLAACTVVGETTVVSDDSRASALAAELGAEPLDDPGDGQGAAVAAALDGAAGLLLVVNADLPCVVPHDLRALGRATPPGGLAYVPADDGTTNALGLFDPGLFAPVYGPGSAARFHRHAEERGATAMPVAIPSLRDDVDTMDDLRRVGLRAGPRTQAAIAVLGLAA